MTLEQIIDECVARKLRITLFQGPTLVGWQAQAKTDGGYMVGVGSTVREAFESLHYQMSHRPSLNVEPFQGGLFS